MNFVDMGMLQEKYSLDTTLQTAQILKEVENDKSENLKKVYNVKLVNWLEAQQTEWEVTAEYRNGAYDPSGLPKKNFIWRSIEEKIYIIKIRN